MAESSSRSSRKWPAHQPPWPLLRTITQDFYTWWTASVLTLVLLVALGLNCLLTARLQIFRSVNHLRYGRWKSLFGWWIYPLTHRSDDDPFPPAVDEDRSSATSSSQLWNTTATKRRREIIWHTADVSDSDTNLHEISEQYGSFIYRHMDSRHQIPQLHVVDGPAYHQCAGYQREELNLTHHVLYNNVLVRPTPSVDEICVICGKPPIIPPLVRVVGKFVCDFCQDDFSQRQRLRGEWIPVLIFRRTYFEGHIEIIKWRCHLCGGVMDSKPCLFHHLRFTCPTIFEATWKQLVSIDSWSRLYPNYVLHNGSAMIPFVFFSFVCIDRLACEVGLRETIPYSIPLKCHDHYYRQIPGRNLFAARSKATPLVSNIWRVYPLRHLSVFIWVPIGICMMSKNSLKSIDTRRRPIVSFIQNQMVMNCNALGDGLTILCHFFKFAFHSRSPDVLLLIILDQEVTFAWWNLRKDLRIRTAHRTEYCGAYEPRRTCSKTRRSIGRCKLSPLTKTERDAHETCRSCRKVISFPAKWSPMVHTAGYSLQKQKRSVERFLPSKLFRGCETKSVRKLCPHSGPSVLNSLDLGRSSQVRLESCVRVIQILHVFGCIAAP